MDTVGDTDRVEEYFLMAFFFFLKVFKYYFPLISDEGKQFSISDIHCLHTELEIYLLWKKKSISAKFIHGFLGLAINASPLSRAPWDRVHPT